MLSRLRKLLFEGEVLRLMGLFLLVKPIGLVTQMLTARYFGAGAALDAWSTVMFLIGFLETPVNLTFTASVIPFFIRLRDRLSRRQLLGVQNSALLAFMLPVLAYITLLYFRSDWVLQVIGRNLPDETRDHVLRLVAYVALPGIAACALPLLKGILNLNRRFRVVGAMPLFNGVSILLAVVLLHKQLGIYALPVGYAVSRIGQLLILGAFALKTRCLGLVRPVAPGGAMSRLWVLTRTLAIANLILAVHATIDKIFATGLAEGSVSSIFYSMVIINLGTQLFSVSLVTVMFTRMSELIADEDIAGFNEYLSQNIARVVRIVVPVALALSVSSDEIVKALFERGAFDYRDVIRTRSVLSFYLLGLPALILNFLVNRTYHSLQRLTERIWLNIQVLATNFIGNLILVKILQVTGLAISTSVSINIHIVLSLWLLHRFRLGLQVGRWAALIGRSYALGVLTYLVYRLTGFGRVMDAWQLDDTSVGCVGVAAVKAAFILIVFTAGYLVWRRISPLQHTTEIDA